MTTLIKTKTLLYNSTSEKPYYVGDVDEGVASSVVFLELTEEAWVDMRRPDTITVTIELGDTLNEDAQ